MFPFYVKNLWKHQETLAFLAFSRAIKWEHWLEWVDASMNRGHPLNTHAKFPKKLTFLTPWYAHVHVRIRGLEMLVFRKTLRTFLMDGPLCYLVVLDVIVFIQCLKLCDINEKTTVWQDICNSVALFVYIATHFSPWSRLIYWGKTKEDKNFTIS